MGILAVVLVVLSALAVSGQPPIPGRHTDHGRFGAQSAGYPPQPIGVTASAPVSAQAYAGASGGDAVARALDDPDVVRLLGDRPELIGVAEVASKGGAPAAHEVTWYVPGRVGSVVATVAGGRVVDVEEVPAAAWQPPLTGDEVDRAVAIARDAWAADGVDTANLQGFGMHVMDADGSYPSTRMAYVTFAPHVDARPELLTWVDLTAGEVVRTRRQPPGPSPDAPSHTGWSGDAGPPRSGTVDWRGWTFDYAVSGRMDGIALQDVAFRGVRVLERASMPAMTVFYDEDACGPFVDRLGGELTPVDWADGAEVVLREVTVLGEPWLELGILDTLGEYVLYQSFYLGGDGQLDAHTFAKGLQCETDHVHYPFWRFDVDLAGADGDQVVRDTADGEAVMATEFDLPADAAAGHRWAVVDAATGHRVDVAFDDGSWNVPGQVVPEVLYETNTVHGRQYQAGEAGTWRWPAVRDLPQGDPGTAIDDVVLWYRGFLPHTADEGPDLWHSTGVRLTVDLAPGHFVRPRD